MIIQDSKLLQGLVHYLSLSAESVRVDDAVEYFVDTETLLKGTPTDITYETDRVDREDEAAYFDGVTGKIVFSSIPFDFTGNISICMWIRLGEITSTTPIFHSTGLQIYVDGASDADRLKVSRNGSDYVYSENESMSIQNDLWIMITSADDGTTNLYISDRGTLALSGDADQDAGTPSAITSFTLGYDNSNYLNAKIWDICVWNKVLDARTILLSRDLLI